MAAHRAHHETGGLFDPRVLGALLAWGYDRTFADVVGSAPTRRPCRRARPGPGRVALPTPAEPWEPVVLPGDRRAWTGSGQPRRTPIDLGGIGKGLAVRWAAAELVGAGALGLVDAGRRPVARWPGA